MPKLIFTLEEVEAYLKTLPNVPVYSGNKYATEIPSDEKCFDPLHPFYVEAIRTADCMRVHADGFFPYKLIRERRPNETVDVLAYREKIWVAKTKPVFSKVMNCLNKIRRSSDWVVKYDESWGGDFPKVAPDETLEKYCEEKYPYFTSVTNWAFSFFLRKYLIDPNAVCFVKPMDTGIEINELLKPIPEIFDSVHVLDFVADDYAVLLNPYGAVYYDGRGKQRFGHSVYLVTTQQIIRYDQVNVKNDFEDTVYTHNLGILPAFKLGGTLIQQTDNYFLFESRIAGMIPELDEAVREYSDLQAAKVLHIYPERWTYTNTECTNCSGTGKVIDVRGEGNDITCEHCHGIGYYVNNGPYAQTIITPNKTTDGTTGNVPSPPIGFVQKDSEIVKLQNEGIQQHIYDALAAINFEFAANAPLAQSGISKQYDRNESNNTTHAVAEDIVAAMDKIYGITTKYRYKALYPDPEILEKMAPHIPVPENYDLFSIADSQDELNKAKSSNTNPVIINALEVDFAAKRFNADNSVKDEVSLMLILDPLPNISEDNKMSRLSNKGITQEAYVISSNINEFVQRAIDENKEFPDLPLKEQRAKMAEYAKVIIDAQQAKAKLIAMAGPAASGVDPATGKLTVTDPAGDPVPNPALPKPTLGTRQTSALR